MTHSMTWHSFQCFQKTKQRTDECLLYLVFTFADPHIWGIGSGEQLEMSSCPPDSGQGEYIHYKIYLCSHIMSLQLKTESFSWIRVRVFWLLMMKERIIEGKCHQSLFQLIHYMTHYYLESVTLTSMTHNLSCLFHGTYLTVCHPFSQGVSEVFLIPRLSLKLFCIT